MARVIFANHSSLANLRTTGKTGPSLRSSSTTAAAGVGGRRQ
jgi:hypothetical protein